MAVFVIVDEADGTELGRATLTDGQLVASGVAETLIAAQVRAGASTAEAFSLYEGGWSNGYVTSKPGPVAASNAATSQFFATGRMSQTRLDDKYDPEQHRGPGGKWATDGLKLAGRIHLGDSETLVSSKELPDSGFGGSTPLAAVVDAPKGRQLRLGIIPGDDKSRWTAANKGSTVQLDNAGVAQLSDSLQRVQQIGQAHQNRHQAEWDAYDARREDLSLRAKGLRSWNALINADDTMTHVAASADDIARAADLELELANVREPDIDPDQPFGNGVLASGPWGNLVYDAAGHDDGEGGWGVRLAVAPSGADPLQAIEAAHQENAEATLGPAEVAAVLDFLSNIGMGASNG